MKIIKEQVAKIIAMSFSSENEQHESQNGTHFGCKNIVRNIQFDDYWNQQENGSDVHIVDGSVTDVDPDSADEENDSDYDDANEFQYQDNDNRIDFGNLESNHVQMRMGSEKYFTMNVCPTILSNENDPTSDKYNMAMERNEHDSTNESEIPFISKLTELEKNSIFNDNHPDGKTIEEEQKFTFWMNKLQEASRRQTEIKQKQEFEDKNDFTDVSSELDERTFDSEGKFAYWYNKLENASRIVYKKKRKHELDEGIIIKAGSSFASEYEIVGNIRESQSDPLKLFVTIRKRCSQPKRVRTSMTSLSGVNSPIENNTKVNKKANESISKVIDFKTSQSFGNDQSTRRQINYEPYQQKSGCRIFDDLPDEISLHQRYFPREPMRPPITIHPLHHALPPTLQHLSPDTKVDIFDRKTCKILKGEDGICVKDLPTVLRYHAEYEPIIPHQETKRYDILFFLSNLCNLDREINFLTFMKAQQYLLHFITFQREKHQSFYSEERS